MQGQMARRDTSYRGDLSEFEIATALMRAGRRVLRPLSSASRYDLVIDEGNGSFTRVQCKTGVLRNGGIVFRTYRVSGHNTRAAPYHGEIDAFAVYCPATQAAYLVPVDAVGQRSGSICLRVAPARNGQSDGVHPAALFLIRSDNSLAAPTAPPRPPWTASTPSLSRSR